MAFEVGDVEAVAVFIEDDTGGIPTGGDAAEEFALPG
jgi:hypothetical protein